MKTFDSVVGSRLIVAYTDSLDVRELHNCSNRESVHCLDVYTRSLFMSIVHRSSEIVSF